MKSTMTEQCERRDPRTLSHRELVLLRRAAEDAIHAANPRYGPFIDAVANPLKLLALVDMAMRSLAPDADAPGEAVPSSTR